MKKHKLFLLIVFLLMASARAERPVRREPYYRTNECLPVEQLEKIYIDSFKRHGLIYYSKEIKYYTGIENNWQSINLIFYLDVKIENNLGLGVIEIVIQSTHKQCVRYFSAINSNYGLSSASNLGNTQEVSEMKQLFQTKLKLVEQDFENWVDKSKDTYFIIKE